MTSETDADASSCDLFQLRFIVQSATGPGPEGEVLVSRSWIRDVSVWRLFKLVKLKMPRRKKEEEELLSDKDRAPRGAANARERTRMRVLSKAFGRLKVRLNKVLCNF